MTFSSDPINTLENLIHKNKTKSISIYLVLVLAILVLLFLLPIIKVDISSQSRGIIRSKTDNVPITTIVSGRVTWLALKNNAIGAKDLQSLKAIQEVAAYPGPSLIIAYSHCGEHGYELKHATEQQEKAVDSGYWPLFRFDPSQPKGKRFKLDSKDPSIPLKDFMYNEARFTRVVKENAELGAQLLEQAQDEVHSKWERLELYRDL